MNPWIEVIVPQLGVNEDKVTVVEWRVTTGDKVQRGQILATLETTKATLELDCEEEGYIYLLASAGERVSVRGAIAIILPVPDDAAVQRYYEAQPPRKDDAQEALGGRTLTAKARELVAQHRLDITLLPEGRIVRERDVLALLERGGPSPAVAETVKSIAIYGASQGGLAVLECVLSAGAYRAVAFLDDNPDMIGGTYGGLPVWSGGDMATLRERGVEGYATHIASGPVRLALRDRALAAGVVPVNVIHARAHVASSAKLGAGNLIKAGAIVDAYAELGDCCIIDNGVVLPHHNRVGDACHLAPGCCFGGDCDIGDGAIVGIGAQVAARMRIGCNAIIGVGAQVVRDVPDNAVVEGAPARVVGTRNPR